MIYNIHYELATAGILAIMMLVLICRRRLPIKSNKMYMCLLVMVLMATYLSAIQGMVNNNISISVQIQYVVNMLAYITGVLVMAVYNDYTMTLFHCRVRQNAVLLLRYVIPLLCIGIIITTPFSRLYFYIDSDGVYHDGNARLILNILCLISIFAMAVVIYACGKRKDNTRYRLMLLIDCLVVAAVIMTYILDSRQRLVYMVTDICVYMYYFAMQSPDFYVDVRTRRFNREGFIEVLRERMDYGKPTACYLVRVRNYNAMKMIYEEVGLQKVQRQMIEIIQYNVPAASSVYHIGASTYAVMMNSVEEVQNLHNKIVKKMPYQWNNDRDVIFHEYSYYRVSYPEDSDNIDEILQRMHYARSDHKGHHADGELIHLHDEALEEATRHNMVTHRIEEAILDNSLELNYQPIYSFDDQRITSMEVLSRLKDEHHNYIDPEYFIHVAESNHTILQLSTQMFEKACDFAVNNHIFELGINDMNINLSPVQCSDEHLATTIQEIAVKHRIPMNRFHFEITESRLTDATAVYNMLRKLQETGAKIALDDFGTGYSNIASIMLLPVDYVKIDKSLLWSYTEGNNEFLDELMPMIRGEGKKIIAEGIETEEHIDILKRMGGAYLQGYYYSKPLDGPHFIQYLKKHNKTDKKTMEFHNEM